LELSDLGFGEGLVLDARLEREAQHVPLADEVIVLLPPVLISFRPLISCSLPHIVSGHNSQFICPISVNYQSSGSVKKYLSVVSLTLVMSFSVVVSIHSFLMMVTVIKILQNENSLWTIDARNDKLMPHTKSLHRRIFFYSQMRSSMNFRTRLSFLTLESRENPSGPALVPPYSTGAPATTSPATAIASGGATTGAASTTGGASITSTGAVNIGTTIGTAIVTGATSGTGTSTSTGTSGILGINSITGQPLLESSLVGN
jgi:hypothetical protein